MSESAMVSHLLPAAFLIGGVLMMIFGIRAIMKIRARRRTWLRYPGEAFDYVWESNGNSNSIQFWMLRWIDNQGVQRTARNPYGSSGGTFKSFPFPVEVLVNPDDPKDGRVARGGNSGVAGTLAAIGVGLLFSFVGALWLYVELIAS